MHVGHALIRITMLWTGYAQDNGQSLIIILQAFSQYTTLKKWLQHPINTIVTGWDER